MKRFLILAILAMLAIAPASAQTITTVTGTVLDPQGIPYAAGTVLPVFVNVSGGATPTITATSAPLIPPTQPVTITSSGTFSVSLVANGSITPGSTHWNFTICSAPGAVYPDSGSPGSPACFQTGNITISGSSQSITSNINSVPPPSLFATSAFFAPGAGLTQFNNTVRLTADSSGITSTSLVAIPGLSWPVSGQTLPALNFSFFCNIAYSQATAAAADAFGIQATTNAPTRIDASGDINTAAAVKTSADLTNLATTTATNIVTFTPSASGTVFHGTLTGTFQLAAPVPAAIQIMALTGSASDALTIKAGSYCTITP